MSNFGPIDTSVLYGQLNHRTEDVSENPDTTLSVRRGDIAFFRVLQLAPRHIRVLQVLQNMGFLGVLQCGHVEIDTHLITALVERWRPETHTFHFSVGEATITLQDIAILWALPVEGNLITGIDTSVICDSPFEAVLQEARICAMCILGGVLCPDATGNTIWAWSRIITLAPIPSSESSTLMPTIIDPDNVLPNPPYAARWSYHIYRTHTAHNALRIIRNVLDRMQFNEFIWTPYDDITLDLDSLPFYATRTPWHIRCPLINYSIVEMQHPERVLRQFGFVQNIPPNPLISERRLHTIDRRGRQDMNWATFHADYIAKWNDVQSLRVEGPVIQGGLDTVSDYMNWYHQITRVQNSHNILSTNTPGYRPTDTRDWEYVYNRMEQLVIDCENSGDDQQSLRDTRARARTIGREIMNFSSSRYPNVRVRPAETARGNAFGEAGPSSVYAEAGPSTVCTEAGPSSCYPETGPSTVYTPNAPYMPSFDSIFTHNMNPEIRRQYDASPVPFENTDVHTPGSQRDDNPPRRNRRRPRCGNGGHY
ncbi:UNVERIFIED_CONTAM: Serine/threonine-protein phosphatase 7 long form [Sesamum indicum]